MEKEKIKSCRQLLEEYQKRYEKRAPNQGDFLKFNIGGDTHSLAASFKDNICTGSEVFAANITIYNPTKPIRRHGKCYLLGRVEPLDSEKSKIMFFEESNGTWKVIKNIPVFDLQDPFHIENVQGYNILGGVQVDFDNLGNSNYETVFYCYKESVLELVKKDGSLVEPFAKGPQAMKDIRLIELKNNNIGVFTRPQGKEAGLGKIAYIEIGDLGQLEALIPKAKIIPNQFLADEWGGVNELHLLESGEIGVLGHIAHFDGCVRHYYAMTFIFDPNTHKASPIRILTTADEFPPTETKRPDLGKIIFSGGLHRYNDGTAILYVGVGDTKAGKIKIEDPFAALQS